VRAGGHALNIDRMGMQFVVYKPIISFMTWVIAASSILGYGVIISDVCVTFKNDDGTQETKDCLQKIHWIAPSIIAGFAGSVKIGFELLEDLAGFLYIPQEEQGNGSWIPQWVAENWRERAKSIFDGSPDDLRECGSQILMVCTHPTEDLGFPSRPRIYVTKMESPLFEPLVASDYSRIFSIGSGSSIPLYMATLQELVPEDGYHPLMQLDIGDMGGWAHGLAFQLTQAIKNHQAQGVSKHLHIGVVTRRRYYIIPNDWSETQNGELVDFKMPRVATNWEELQQFCASSNVNPGLAIA
jgi:hypothetical protein